MMQDKPAPLGGAVCLDVISYLKKDRFTPDVTASADKREQKDPTKDARCDLCSNGISIQPGDDESTTTRKKNHYVMECPAVPGVIPGPRASRLELLERVAALGLVKRLGTVERVTDQIVKGVFRFSPKGGSGDPKLGDGQQRSDKEPPDKGCV